jgi:hypothetical protein
VNDWLRAQPYFTLLKAQAWKWVDGKTLMQLSRAELERMVTKPDLIPRLVADLAALREKSSLAPAVEVPRAVARSGACGSRKGQARLAPPPATHTVPAQRPTACASSRSTAAESARSRNWRCCDAFRY